MTMVGMPHIESASREAPRTKVSIVTSAGLVPFTEIIPPDNGSPILPPDPRRSLNEMFQTVWRWRRRFLVVFGSVLFLGVLALFVMPLKYTAHGNWMSMARSR